ncbi:hypothetical protein ABPG72_018055 [Tetrahymena utriculariae]
MVEVFQLQNNIREKQSSFQLLVYDNNLSSAEDYQFIEKNIPQELYQKKGFVVKKQFEVVPILTRQIQSATKYLLFGFQEIETYYKDYTDPYDFDLQSQLNRISNSGITDFIFLIELFSRFTTQDYHKLYMQLIQYQYHTKLQIQYIQDIKIQLNQRLISLEDQQQSRVYFLQFVDNFVKSQIDQGNYFYAYELFMIDIDRIDMNTDRKCVSQSLMSLLGVEPEDY